MRTNDAGEPEWERTYPGRFEATDVALHTVNGVHQGYTFTGHGGENGTLDGQLTRVGLDGTQIWARTFGDPVGGVGSFAGLDGGDPQLIFDECWGVQGLADGGSIVACGTGIEGCDLVENDAELATRCRQDPRRTWRGYVVRFDSDGDLLWQRMDSFVEPGAGDDVSDAASEYVALLPNGGFMSVVDQGFGIGLLALEPESDRPEPIEDPEEMPADPDGTDPDEEASEEENTSEDEDGSSDEQEEEVDDGDVMGDDEYQDEDAPDDDFDDANGSEDTEASEGLGCAVSRGTTPSTLLIFGGLLIGLLGWRRYGR